MPLPFLNSAAECLLRLASRMRRAEGSLAGRALGEGCSPQTEPGRCLASTWRAVLPTQPGVWGSGLMPGLLPSPGLSCRAWIGPCLSPCSGDPAWLGPAPPRQDPGWQRDAWPGLARVWIFPLLGLSPCSGDPAWLGPAPPRQDPGWQRDAVEVRGVHPSLSWRHGWAFRHYGAGSDASGCVRPSFLLTAGHVGWF